MGVVQPEGKPRLKDDVVAKSEAAQAKRAANAWDFDQSLEQIAEDVPVTDDRPDARN